MRLAHRPTVGLNALFDVVAYADRRQAQCAREHHQAAALAYKDMADRLRLIVIEIKQHAERRTP